MEFALGDLRGSEMAAKNALNRRLFIGGSDARIIMSPDEAALIRLWKEKRGEAEPEDLSENLVVQLGVATEALNRAWWRAFQIDPVAFVVSGSRKRTPFPGRKSMPAASSAFFTSSRVDERLGGIPSTLSKRWMVGRLTPARSASCLAVMLRPARAARI